MSGTKASWTPERRARAAEATRAQMACPARCAQQAKVMRKTRKRGNSKAWLAARRRPERCAVDRRTMKGLHARPGFTARVVRAAANGASAAADRRRGGAVPAGYGAVYRRLREGKKLPAKEALRLVRAQRARDLARQK
jgi:hypothetical protein